MRQVTHRPVYYWRILVCVVTWVVSGCPEQSEGEGRFQHIGLLLSILRGQLDLDLRHHYTMEEARDRLSIPETNREETRQEIEEAIGLLKEEAQRCYEQDWDKDFLEWINDDIRGLQEKLNKLNQGTNHG